MAASNAVLVSRSRIIKDISGLKIVAILVANYLIYRLNLIKFNRIIRIMLIFGGQSINLSINMQSHDINKL